MTGDYITRQVQKLIERYGETEPERLCRAMDVLVMRQSMGREENACKGFFLCKCRVRLIMLNADLPRPLQRIILAHELGHAVLHDHLSAEAGFHDFSLFDEASVCEYEANLFAAELLLPDERVLEQLEEDSSFFHIARSLHVPPELLDFKLRLMNRRGFHLPIPLDAKSTFLQHLGRDGRF